MKDSLLAGTLAAMPSANGARMPSTADDVFAEIRSAALRLASVRLRRYVAAGCIVRTTAEVLLVSLPEWAFSREPDALTGFDELVARPVFD